MYRDIVQDVPCTLNFVNNIVYGNSGPLAGAGVRRVGGVWASNLWYDVRGKDKAQFDGLEWDAWVASGKFDFTLKPDYP